MNRTVSKWIVGGMLLAALLPTRGFGAVDVSLMDVPDYGWWAGCFGTATGNLAGYWDRNGFPNIYTGPVNGGLAPMNSRASEGHDGIISLWASQAGVDGRPIDQPGHYDDYYVAYESTAPDPYLTAGRPEHEPDSIGDFIGLSQDKWTNMNGECSGNIDGFSFVFWDHAGHRRDNYQPVSEAGLPIVDIPSGLRAWTAWRQYSADVFSQLAEFNSNVSPGLGFTFEDLTREIDSGYPILMFLQAYDLQSRNLPPRTNVNPNIHAMLAYGYVIHDDGRRFVRCRTSWAEGDNQFREWNSGNWTPLTPWTLPLRGVIGYHPLPQITRITKTETEIHLDWQGPSARLKKNGTIIPVHRYVVEKSTRTAPSTFLPVSPETVELNATLPRPTETDAYFRVRLLEPRFESEEPG